MRTFTILIAMYAHIYYSHSNVCTHLLFSNQCMHTFTIHIAMYTYMLNEIIIIIKNY